MSVDVQAPNNREDRLQSGIILAEAGKLEEAAAEFNALLAENSQDTEVLNNLAIVYRLQEKSQDALGALIDAIDIDPTKAEYQYNLGKVYKQLGNFKSAAMACAKAVESDPSLISAYINLGAMYYLLHEFGKAANFLKKGLDVDPSNEILRANYDSALEAKQIAESSGNLPARAEITEAADIFLGAEPEPGTPQAEAASYTLTGIVSLLRYLRELVASFPASAQRVFSEQGLEQSIEGIIEALTRLEEDAPQTISGPAAKAEPAGPAPKPAPPGDDAAETHSTISVSSLTGMLTHLGKLARTLPQTEQRDTVTQKVENIIEGLNAATAATAASDDEGAHG
jgi:tetratricopeptide (TPR) repeat protein